jgi:aminopeptidase C
MRQSDPYEETIKKLASKILEIEGIELRTIFPIEWDKVERQYPQIEKIVETMKEEGTGSITYRQRNMALLLASRQQRTNDRMRVAPDN